jgi:hypothetical protein
MIADNLLVIPVIDYDFQIIYFCLIKDLGMKITLDIRDNQFDTFLNFIKTLDYVSVHDEENIPEWQQQEVNNRITAINNDKMKTRSWDEAQKEIFKK